MYCTLTSPALVSSTLYYMLSPVSKLQVAKAESMQFCFGSSKNCRLLMFQFTVSFTFGAVSIFWRTVFCETHPYRQQQETLTRVKCNNRKVRSFEYPHIFDSVI